MASEERAALEESLVQYEQQLLAVQLALQGAGEDQAGDLVELQRNLEEVIALTKASLHTSSPSSSTSATESPTTNDIDTEFAKFQDEISQLTTTEGTAHVNEASGEEGDPAADDSHSRELSQLIEQLEGSQVRVPFSRDWAHTDYHNAVVLSVDSDSIRGIDNISVTVMFTHPQSAAMKPCSFFLEGHCKFSAEQCRFSHGYPVHLSDLREYFEPDFATLRQGSLCLVKNASDGLWQQAAVVEWDSGSEACEAANLVVRMSHSGKTARVKLQDAIPLPDQGGASDSETDDDCDDGDVTNSCGVVANDDEDDNDVPLVIWVPAENAGQPLGSWEKHTRGIASKLMEKMGYVWGQGLGIRGNGRTEPVEAVVLPQGKSLDKCMELREKNMTQDSVKIQRKMLRQKEKAEAKLEAGYQKAVAEKSVFDFLNDQIFTKKHGKVHDKPDSKCKSRPGGQDLKDKSDKGLSVESLQVTEGIRKAEREISRLNQSLLRNKDKDRVMHSRVKQKIEEQHKLINQLKSRERHIHAEQQHRKGNDKLRIF
ncbi:zinc finger CCCH-type with G patch domain-containing protein-like [Ornithodoros turicata]|uniref:zinc finger CCCH-type with G patch domain-containing protein-like n=1 Tax=Ornithodoros turicata TaxID=34597 RepID=UPI00313A44B5